MVEKIVLSFSVYTNGVKILSTKQSAGSLGAVNGIRFLSMAWVILGHTYYFAASYTGKYHFMYRYSSKKCVIAFALNDRARYLFAIFFLKREVANTCIHTALLEVYMRVTDVAPAVT